MSVHTRSELSSDFDSASVASIASLNQPLGPVHTTPKEFQNGRLILKTDQMFFVHTAVEEVENATITGHFGFVVKENLGTKIT